MTALQALNVELKKRQHAMNKCVTEEGHIKSSARYLYQVMVGEAREIQQGINFLTNLYEEVHNDRKSNLTNH